MVSSEKSSSDLSEYTIFKILKIFLTYKNKVLGKFILRSYKLCVMYKGLKIYVKYIYIYAHSFFVEDF